MGVRSAIASLRRKPAPVAAAAVPDVCDSQHDAMHDLSPVDLDRVPEVLRPLFAPPPRLTRLSSQQYVERMVEWMQSMEATKRVKGGSRPVYCGWYDLDEIHAWFDWYAENHDVEPLPHVVLCDRLKSVSGVLFRRQQRLGSEQFAIVAARRLARGCSSDRPSVFYIPPPDHYGTARSPVEPRQTRSSPVTSMVATRGRSGDAAAPGKSAVQRPENSAASYRQPSLALGDDLHVGVEIAPRRRAA